MWFFRVLEREDGTWACGRGRQVVDEHHDLDDAVEHCKALAAQDYPSKVLVHHRHQTPVTIAEFGEPGQPGYR